MAADAALGLAGLHEVSTATRLVSGGIFGFCIALVVVPGACAAAADLLSWFSSFPHPKGTIHARETR